MIGENTIQFEKKTLLLKYGAYTAQFLRSAARHARRITLMVGVRKVFDQYRMTRARANAHVSQLRHHAILQNC